MESREVEIGRAARELREAAGLSQDVVANEMVKRGHPKWSQSTVWSVEKGSRPLRFSEAESLADVLGTSVLLFAVDGVQRTLEFLLGELRRTGSALGMSAVEFQRTQERIRNYARYEELEMTEEDHPYLGRATYHAWLRLSAPQVAAAALQSDGGEVGVVYEPAAVASERWTDSYIEDEEMHLLRLADGVEEEAP